MLTFHMGQSTMACLRLRKVRSYNGSWWHPLKFVIQWWFICSVHTKATLHQTTKSSELAAPRDMRSDSNVIHHMHWKLVMPVSIFGGGAELHWKWHRSYSTSLATMTTTAGQWKQYQDVSVLLATQLIIIILGPGMHTFQTALWTEMSIEQEGRIILKYFTEHERAEEIQLWDRGPCRESKNTSSCKTFNFQF